MHVADLLSRRARLSPEHEALCELETGRRYTYRQLNERAKRAVHFLQMRCGVQMGDRVSILAHNSVAYVDLLYGLAKIGAIFAPLNWRLLARELAYIVADCQPKVLVVGPEFMDVWRELQPLVDVPHVVALQEAAGVDLLSYEKGLASASAAEPARAPGLDGETAHCILYTSGTTGRPKGAVIPQRQVLWNSINTVVSWDLRSSDVSPVFTPLFHTGGLFAFMAPIFYAGGRVVLARTFDAEASLRAIEAQRCTVILGVPTLFQMWRASPAYGDADFSHVRFFISGGAPCPPSLMASWREEKDVVFRQGYGLTEAGPNCFSMTDEESRTHAGTVGKPVLHSEMRLVDEQGCDVAPGAVGELLIKGPHVCAGYWRNEAATSETIRDGWLHTGDMARRDEDGFYTIVGRYKDMIISGGENVYAAEVEAVFREHSAVQEAALIGKRHETWGEVGLMVVVLKEGQATTSADLLDFCRRRLASYKVPKEVVFASELPYSPYGKVQKMQLREEFGA